MTGRDFSRLRNSGEDLPTEPVKVGNSWVTPTELADEYDKHFPPGPRRTKQVTDKIFHYEMVMPRDCRGELVGLNISCRDRTFDILEQAEIFHCHDPRYREKIRTSLCNRYDVIKGDGCGFIIDKQEESISVSRARFRVDAETFCEEAPIAGNHSLTVEDRQHGDYGQTVQIGRTYFPFIKFDLFQGVWDGYVRLRTSQIEEIRVRV